MPVSGGDYGLEKTWRASGIGTVTFNSPGNFTIPYGKNLISFYGQGGVGGNSTPNYSVSPGAATAYSTTGGNISTYNTVPGSANYSIVPGTISGYNTTPGNNPASYNTTGGNIAAYNTVPGNPASYYVSGGTVASYSTVPGSVASYYVAGGTPSTYAVSYPNYAYISQITSNIPSSTGINLTNGASSDHLAGWYLNRHGTDYYYADQGPYNTSNGATNGQICQANAPFNGDVNPSCALGLVVRYQQFISTYCLGGATWPTAYLEHQTQSGGWTFFGYNVTYVAGARPTGYASIGAILAGDAFAAAILPYIINAAIPSGGAQNTLLNRLKTYTWTSGNIASNFADFAAYAGSLAGGQPATYNPPTTYVTSILERHHHTVSGFTTVYVGGYNPPTVLYGTCPAYVLNANGWTTAYLCTTGPGTVASYNPIAYTVTSYNTLSYPVGSYNPPAYPVASYNPLSYPVASSNPTTYPISAYNTILYPTASYNAPTYAIAGYNSPSYTISAYNSPAYPAATYNTILHPVTAYAPPTYPIAGYNVGGNGGISSAFGVTMPGGIGGYAPVISTSYINPYVYPDNTTYPITVAPGGVVVIKSE